MVVDRLFSHSIVCIFITMALVVIGGCGKSDSVAENAPPKKSTTTRDKVDSPTTANTDETVEDRSSAAVPVVNTSPPSNTTTESSPSRKTTTRPARSNNNSSTAKNSNSNKKAPGIRGLGDVAGKAAAKEPAPAPTLPAAASPSGKMGTKAGDLIPEINGEDVDGVEFSLSDYAGKVVMLDFWGDW